MTARPVVVLGAGPAGAVTAAGLARLGEPVVLVGEPRRIAAVEGVSTRVIDALRALDFSRAVGAFEPPSPRRAIWSGLRADANREHLVDRRHLDRALLDDVERLGVEVVRGRITAAVPTPAGHDVHVQQGGNLRVFAARFIVEARGRAAPSAGRPRLRGVETVSLAQVWQGEPGQTGAAVEIAETGLAWMASLRDGRRYLQCFTDADRSVLPPKAALAGFCACRFAGLEAAHAFLQGAEPLGQPLARASTSILNAVLAGDDWIRVGDAAMAVDPLSGNGVFQSLSSALQAPAVIRTLLRSPERAALARDFHHQRIEHLFHRFARIGRDFYAGETRWADAPFWQARSRWPDAEPLHREVTPARVTVARRPVVQDDEIVEADVVVTPDQPLGMWHLNGLPLAAALQAARTLAPGQTPREALAARLDLSAPLSATLADWMRRQGWIEGPI